MDRDQKKIRLVKLLEILSNNSDIENYIDTKTILKKLSKMGIDCDRRTLYSDIEVLNSFGYEILCEKKKGVANKYCLGYRKFTVPELRILMDAVQASKFITPKKTAELVEKIANLSGSFRGELLTGSVVKFNTTKSTNENIFYSISEINCAIDSGKKVSFYYFDFDLNHQKVLRKNGKRYYVNPLATIYDNTNYYLVCYYGKHEGLVHYRIDRMDRVEMVDNQPIEPYLGKPVDLTHYKKTLFDMYQGEEKAVQFVADRTLLDVIFDTFGEDVNLTPLKNNQVSFTAYVQLSPTFFGWCLSFGEKLKITSPTSAKNMLKEYISTLKNLYD